MCIRDNMLRLVFVTFDQWLCEMNVDISQKKTKYVLSTDCVRCSIRIGYFKFENENPSSCLSLRNQSYDVIDRYELNKVWKGGDWRLVVIAFEIYRLNKSFRLFRWLRIWMSNKKSKKIPSKYKTPCASWIRKKTVEGYSKSCSNGFFFSYIMLNHPEREKKPFRTNYCLIHDRIKEWQTENHLQKMLFMIQ